jgi:2-methylisocitrate lyase-like PEP mutase family enzyme
MFKRQMAVILEQTHADGSSVRAQVLKVTPCIADGDTGYGNAVNVKRTVKGYAQVRPVAD